MRVSVRYGKKKVLIFDKFYNRGHFWSKGSRNLLVLTLISSSSSFKNYKLWENDIRMSWTQDKKERIEISGTDEDLRLKWQQ